MDSAYMYNNYYYKQNNFVYENMTKQNKKSQ